MKLLRTVDGYSYYENPDSDLVKKIKSEPKPTEFVDWFTFKNKLSWSLTKKNKDKLIMETTEGDIMSIDQETYDDLVNKTHLSNINTKFLVMDTFNEYFAPFKDGSSIITAVTDKFLINPFRTETFYSGVNGIFVGEEWRTRIGGLGYLNGTHTISVKFHLSKRFGNGHMYFNEIGEIVNRDYNQDFNLVRPYISKEDSVKEFIDVLNERLPETLEKSGKTYFMVGFGIQIYCTDDDDERVSVSFTPEQKPDVFYSQGESSNKFKKPKKNLEVVSKTELIDKVSVMLNDIIFKKDEKAY
jgi:hypothetical protein